MTDKQDKRLLTPKEIRGHIISCGWILDARHTELMIETCQQIAKAQREMTLREVGEWLNERVMCEHLLFYHRRWYCAKCMEALKQGEFPEGTKD